MHVFMVQSPALQVPSAAQVSPAAQSAGWPQYTGVLPPVPLVVLVLVLVALVLPAPPAPPPPPPSQLAVPVGRIWHVKPAVQPQSVQSPLWHCPSLPHVSFARHCTDEVHPFVLVELWVPLFPSPE
jgi:hypothetical protein